MNDFCTIMSSFFVLFFLLCIAIGINRIAAAVEDK